MNKQCPFCFSLEHTPSYLPSTFFNGKHFEYLTCSNCKLIYVTPLPSQEDYSAMYSPSYQDGINAELLSDLHNKLNGLRFPYQKHFDLIRKYSNGLKILDYGCGQANFLINARHNNFECDGVEYNPAHVEILKKEIPGSIFYTTENFLNDSVAKYDVIRLSNVLEHLYNPQEIMEKLISKLKPQGILLIEGPIETNPTFALLIRKIYFKTSKPILNIRNVKHPPTHIFFSNSKNQREFFQKLNLAELHYEVTECAWPFPESWEEVQGIGSFVKWVIGKFSLFVNPLFKNWGNTFIFVGVK